MHRNKPNPQPAASRLKKRKENRSMKTTQKFVASALIALALTSLGVDNSQSQNGTVSPGIIPPNAHYGGHTYGEWLAMQWQWFLGLPVPDNPNFNGNGSISNGQPEHVWFLPGVVFTGVAELKTLHVAVPAGKALYLVLQSVEADNALCTFPPTDLSVDQLGQLAVSLGIDGTTLLEVEVDGVPVDNPKQYVTVSPVFNITLPEDNVLEAVGCPNPAGTYGPAIAAGYTILFAPLAVGQHTIHYHVEQIGVPVMDLT
jgi:hypothetical protein